MSDDLFQLAGKRALVIGGGLGMGKASSEILSRVGVSVAVLDIDAARAKTVADAIAGRGGTAVPFSADVLDFKQAPSVIAAAADALGGLDILVNIVGMAGWAPAIDMTEDVFELDLSRNLRYQFWWSQAFARRLGDQGQGGAIVSIASVSGLRGAPKHAAYGAAKAGLMALTRTLAVEWADRGIRVNAIAPGSIKTDRMQGGPDAGERNNVIPMGRRGDQTEIAKAVLFLTSDLASYVTGHTLVLDGGVMAKFPFPGF
jgi:NAD(P)-dependent dehydrogenase (short-subunit alcohol dehydrogenase family)